MRFTLIDHVLHCDEQRIIAIKNVTAAEEYLADHFPTFPVLPGVMMLETMAQAARLWIDSKAGDIEGLSDVSPPYAIAGVRNVRYSNMVKPGETLRVEVAFRKVGDDGALEFEGKGYVTPLEEHAKSSAEAVAVQGRFSLKPTASLQPA